jgi:hypothetical protein
MPSTFWSLFSIAFVWFGLGMAYADNPSIVDVKLPPNQWEKLPNDVEVALNLTQTFEGDARSNTLNLFIKNDSTDQLRLDPNQGDLGAKLFYVDRAGVKKFLREYIERTQLLSVMLPALIKPKETLLIKIRISSTETSLLTGYPSGCSFVLYEIPSKREYKFETSPRALIATK